MYKINVSSTEIAILLQYLSVCTTFGQKRISVSHGRYHLWKKDQLSFKFIHGDYLDISQPLLHLVWRAYGD
jgi:hypothetical protein